MGTPSGWLSYDPAARKPPPAGRAWDIMMWADLALLGLLLAATVGVGLYMLFTGSRAGPSDAGTLYSGLWLQSLTLLLLAGLVPVAWAWGTRVGGFAGMVAYYRLDRPLPNIAKGIGVGLLAWGGLVAAVAGLVALGWEPENPQADLIVETVDWPLALALALSAGLGEEILFRGYLQKRIGIWGQALLFSASHASYGTVLQLVMPLMLGLGFGYMVKRGWSLWVPIAGHFAFNFVQLALPLLFPEAV